MSGSQSPTDGKDLNTVHVLGAFSSYEEREPNKRRTRILKFFMELPSQDDDNGLVLPSSGLWNIAIAHPNDSKFVYFGIFECMAALIWKGLKNRR